MRTAPISSRIPTLDGLRAVSIAFVLIDHSASTQNAPFQSGEFFQYLGNLGVRVFFVISGFLITTLLVSKEAPESRVNLANFYRRRIFRILPVFYLYIIVVAVVTLSGGLKIPGKSFLAACTFTANIWTPNLTLRHLWSLSVEEQFYLLWPLALLVLKKGRCQQIALIFVVAGPVVSAFFWYFHASAAASVFLNFTPIAAGSAFALCRDRLHQNGNYSRLYRTQALMWLVPLAAFSLALLKGPFGLHTLVSGVVAICIVIFIDQQITVPSPIFKFLNWRPVTFVGTLSYSLYIWQQIFLDANQTHLVNQFPVNLCLSFITAVLSYYLVERPFIKLGRGREVVEVGKSPSLDNTSKAVA